MNLKFLRETKTWLIAILLVGFFLRFWKISTYPPLLWDEASLGYNAYSVLQTGRDEYGKIFPIIFKSFGDYKPGLYVYLAVPFVAIFGLSELSVRLPSILFGSLAPLFLFLFVKELFGNKRLALIAAVVLVFLPWHIHFSRGAWESNVMVFWILLGSLLVARELRHIEKRLIFDKGWFLALLPFLLALLTYQGAKLAVPLIGLCLLATNWSTLWPILKKGKVVIDSHGQARGTLADPVLNKGSLWPCLVILGVLFWYLLSFSGAAKNRLKVMSLFSYKRPAAEISAILNEDNITGQNIHYYLFHGEWLSYLRGFLARYFNHFSPRFLAFEGDWGNPRHSAPYFGMIGRVGLVFLLVGLGFFLSQKRKSYEYIFLYWLLVSPLPAALSRDMVSGVRSLLMVVPLAFFVAYGIEFLFEVKSVGFKLNFWLFRLIVCGLTLLSFFDFINFLDLYYNHMVVKSPKDWLFGQKEVVLYVNQNKDHFKNIYITDFYGQPYIYYLFYSQYPPLIYQKEAKLSENEFGDVGRVEKLGDFNFKPINWQTEAVVPSTLIVISQDEVWRTGLDKNNEISDKLSKIGTIGSQTLFYGYQNE